MRRAAISIVLVSLANFGSPCLGQISDNFSDLNDTLNPTWTHLNGWVASTGQTWNASTGQYRMTAVNNGAQGLGFVGSHVGRTYTDSKVSADIVSFVDGPSEGAVFALAARLNGNNALAQLTGYSLAYEPHAAGGAGEVVLYRINSGLLLTDIGNQQITLNTANDYRFVLKINGTQLHGQVFEIGGGLVAEVFASDATFASGFAGLIAYSQIPLPAVDVTWDNFAISPPCAADVNDDDAVNVSDLLAVISGWGPCRLPCPPSCAADVAPNCSVNVSDLLAVISSWGPCP